MADLHEVLLHNVSCLCDVPRLKESRDGTNREDPSSHTQVNTANKRSIPDLRTPAALLQAAPDVVHFDSLHSMPLSFDWMPDSAPSVASTSERAAQLDMTTVHIAANWLRERLQLRLFGFDIVVDTCSGAALTASRSACFRGLAALRCRHRR